MGALVKQNRCALMSNEEMKIRNEIENDIERDLEAEIKDEIYHLALRLHRLYQHQKERNTKEASRNNGMKPSYQLVVKKKTVSEVNINIKMEGDTRVEIKATTKKEEPKRTTPRRASRPDGGQGSERSKAMKLEWEKSLRSQKFNSQSNGCIRVSKLEYRHKKGIK